MNVIFLPSTPPNLKSLIRPHGIKDTLIHMGNKGDSGYVVPQTALQCDILYSYGIGGDNTVECDWETRTGKMSHQYDMTIDKLPVAMPNMVFHKKGLSGAQRAETDNFMSHLKENGTKSNNIILKIDVEGWEYDWLPKTNIEELATRVYCLRLEFHDVDKVTDQFAYQMKRLNEYFNVCHWHANNYGVIIHDIPSVPEITMVRKSAPIFTGEMLDYKYPIEGLDYRNDYRLADPSFSWSGRWQ